ncbi:MAG: MBL fold metallo-hydrolase [Kiritimatiellae bacterium]|nr:MBL fold metallo-hydrolase [Kiritimatiellia bacterium]
MNAHSASVRILGSGTSTGVPLVGCTCPVCTSRDPRDVRTRCGIHVEAEGFGLQVDVSPDFRAQALRGWVPRVDAVLVTHCHADHCLGLDDVRRYNTLQGGPIPLYARRCVLDDLSRIFGYIFHVPPSQKWLYRPRLVPTALPRFPAAAQIGPFRVRVLPVPHGPIRSVAVELEYRGRRLVACTDCSRVTPSLARLLEGADVALLDGLRDRPQGAHLTVDVSAAALAASRCGVGRIVHLGHDILHETLLARLAATPRVKPAFDGEVLEL